MNPSYRAHVEERGKLGIPPLPLDESQTLAIVLALSHGRFPKGDAARKWLETAAPSDPPILDNAKLSAFPPDSPYPRALRDALGEEWIDRETPRQTLAGLLARRVPGGVSDPARWKALFLEEILAGHHTLPDLSLRSCCGMLYQMGGGYGAAALARLLSCPDARAAEAAAEALARAFHVLDIAPEVDSLRRQGNPYAAMAMEGWAQALWFGRAQGGGAQAPEGAWRLKLRIYKVDGEVNTDDLSPARHASTRADIPLHALHMGEIRFPGAREVFAAFEEEAIAEMAEDDAEAENAPPPRMTVFAADILGTGSSRKSAANSLQWHLGFDIPGTPNKRAGALAMGGRIAPIFRDTWLDSGGLPITAPLERFSTGDRILLEMRLDGDRAHGRLMEEDSQGQAGQTLEEFTLPAACGDAYRAGGRVKLVIGRKATAFAREALGLGKAAFFILPPAMAPAPGQGYTLAQKIVGRACGKEGVLPGEECEPAMATVASQDTTGPMTRDELTDLACLSFRAGLALQSFCHTAAYPSEADRRLHATLPDFMVRRGGVALRPGDGIIHSWLNRLLLPDTVGTGGDSHTRFPLGISFAAGSGLVAFAAAMGAMPLTMPESALVRFRGELPSGLTVRDVVNTLPLAAIESGQMDAPGAGARNPYNGRIVEMEGWAGLDAHQAFELTNASAERGAAAATIELPPGTVAAWLEDSARWIREMIAAGYESSDTLRRRLREIEDWLARRPPLLRRDPNAAFAAVVEVDLSAIDEPVVAVPNNPDRVARLSLVAGQPIDEVFLGSCMTHASHFEAAAALLASCPSLGVKRLWVAPPTRQDAERLRASGAMDVFTRLGARIEVPGCSLCMGNQARVEDGAAVFSTSTRNFDNRMGRGAQAYLGSAELAAVVAAAGRLPAPDAYFSAWSECAPARARRGGP